MKRLSTAEGGDDPPTDEGTDPPMKRWSMHCWGYDPLHREWWSTAQGMGFRAAKETIHWSTDEVWSGTLRLTYGMGQPTCFWGGDIAMGLSWGYIYGVPHSLRSTITPAVKSCSVALVIYSWLCQANLTASFPLFSTNKTKQLSAQNITMDHPHTVKNWNFDGLYYLDID